MMATCSGTMHVFTEETWGGAPFCECGLRSNPAHQAKEKALSKRTRRERLQELLRSIKP